jgi:hypothetical protein
MPYVVLLIIFGAVLSVWALRTPAFGRLGEPKGCDWEKSYARRTSGLREFRCGTCGQVGYSGADGGPTNCLKNIRSGGA